MRDNSRPDPPHVDAHAALVGQPAALAFANTVAWHAGPSAVDRLGDYAALLAWARERALLTAGEGDALARAAATDPAHAAAAYGRAVTLREGFYRVASALAHRRAPDAADLEAVRAAWADALAHAALVQSPADHVAPLTPAWPVDGAEPAGLDVPRWRLAHAAGEMLTAGPLERLRECANHPCGWLFIDRSRNRSRRWCDSADCGNRVRVREHLARRRAARATHS